MQHLPVILKKQIDRITFYLMIIELEHSLGD